jgi:hypothetical protein
MSAEQEGRISYAVGLQRIAAYLQAEAERFAPYLVGNYGGAPDWPAIAGRCAEDAALCRSLAALIEEIEQYRGAGFNGPWLLQRVAAGFTMEGK